MRKSKKEKVSEWVIRAIENGRKRTRGMNCTFDFLYITFCMPICVWKSAICWPHSVSNARHIAWEKWNRKDISGLLNCSKPIVYVHKFRRMTYAICLWWTFFEHGNKLRFAVFAVCHQVSGKISGLSIFREI